VRPIDPIVRLLVDDNGQDLVEYALLASIIAIVGVLIFPDIATKMANAFASWGTGVNNIWVPNPPSGP
jgi:Flp pilus assembly pilin Flp